MRLSLAMIRLPLRSKLHVLTPKRTPSDDGRLPDFADSNPFMATSEMFWR